MHSRLIMRLRRSGSEWCRRCGFVVGDVKLPHAGPKAGTGALLNQEQQSELVKMFA
jgi:hypothetical protein